MRLALTLAAAAAFGLGACEEHGHDHDGGTNTTIKAKYGGSVLDLATGGPAIEIVFDEKAGTIKLYAYTSAGEPQKLDEAPVVNIEKGPTQVTGKGADDKWSFTHENLKEHPHAIFKVKIGGETYNCDKWHPDDDDDH